MGELNRSFKPETMRLFVKLDKDGKYHEVEGLNGFSIEEEYNWCNNSDATITIRGFNTHVSDDSYSISADTFSADAPIYYCKLNFDYLNDVGTPIAIKMPSKRDDYKRHLPKRVIVNGRAVVCYWPDGSKTYSCCHDGDEMDVRTGILLNAIKKWMPGGTYWQDVMDDVEVEYQGKREKAESEIVVERVGNVGLVKHEPVNHDHPCRPYMRGGRYGDDEKMAVIEDVEGGMAQAEASRKHGISQGTVSNWMREWRSDNA